MSGYSFPYHLAFSSNHVQYPRRESGPFKQHCKGEAGERGSGGGLEDEGISCKESRCHFPAHYDGGHVPWNDSPTHPDRLSSHHGITKRPKAYKITLHGTRYPGEILKDIGKPPDLIHSIPEQLSLLHGKQPGEFLMLLPDISCSPIEDHPPFPDGLFCPCVKGSLGSADRIIHLVECSRGDLVDHLPRCRIGHWNPALICRGYLFSSDPHLLATGNTIKIGRAHV